jgi:hypothetical protein
MKDIIKENLKLLVETKVISQDEINDNLIRLTNEKKALTRERTSISKKIKEVDKQLEYWKNMLPNQISMFE